MPQPRGVQSPAPQAPGAPPPPRRLAVRVLALPLLGALTVMAMMASLTVGDRSMTPGTVIEALLSTDMSLIDHQVVWGSRVPRTVAGVAVGAAIAVAGALVQALTRNPLADPGILGVNAGAAAAVAAGVSLLGIGSMQGQLWCAMIGALVATMAVLAIGASGGQGADPIRLTLAGVAFAAVMAGLTTAITLLDVRAFDAMRTWSAGSLAVRGLVPTLQALPFIAVGLLAAAAAGRYLSAIALGDDLATTLGVPLLKARALGILGVTAACGAATAIAGPIGFVGLMVPHVIRWIVGPQQGWILTLSALAGPSLVLLADVLARVATPGGMPVGVVTAFLGAPVLIAMVRSRAVSGL
nr:iron chelate uptake ABC transporter family permease subunit [Brachybacterium alimentarium]